MKVLKSCLNKKDFIWTEEADTAFQDIKQLLKELPTLTAPIAGETLILYLAASTEAISSVLIAERNGIQMPIYFVSKILQQSEVNYPPIEKLISINKNKKADVLSKLATLTFDHLHKKVLVEVLKDKSIDEKQAIDVVREMHEGLCAHHSGYRTVVGRIMRQGYYWQIIYRDTTKWAIDIVEPFPRSVGNAKFLVVAIDFFSKWVDAKIWLPNEILNDNGKQFADNPFRSWCEELNIKQTFASVAHPQANGQVKVINKEIVAGIKARLGLSQTKWVDEVPYVLWAHRTTSKRSTGETPLSLVCGTEAVISAEIRVLTQRILAFDTESNSSVLRENLNLLEEMRIMAAIRQADAKQKMAKYYNKRVRYVQFKEGDLVLRDNEASRQEKQGKLGPH
ncbi:uncharacterized protein [Rutidosis leptorrhynchoides]|uniref:uncharacterized protein n=1 Tax=Rutidosis leptorrhynchoides TaxID=125765 RepID=UPI003A9A1489